MINRAKVRIYVKVMRAKLNFIKMIKISVLSIV